MKLLFVCLAGALCCPAQTPFRVDVNLVNVGFSVRDDAGRLVGDLTQDEIEVFEDGVPQKISYFARSADVDLNLGLIVDVSGSQESFVKQHHKDLQTFLKNVMKPDDRAYLIAFGNRIRLVDDFSSSPKQIADALDHFDKNKGRELHPELGPREIRILGTAFYDALYYGVTEMLDKVERGRKALIVFSDGEDNSSAHHMMDAIEAAQSSNTLVYAVRYTEVHDGRWNARNKYGLSVMARIAKETGGADFDAREKGLAENFRQIGEELRASYELGYLSTNSQHDGTFHKIAIRVKRPGLTPRAKTGYYPRTGAALTESVPDQAAERRRIAGRIK
ncbi:MAG TPA: VWA domain-containing protein [Bryobacteraceae bacterium]